MQVHLDPLPPSPHYRLQIPWIRLLTRAGTSSGTQMPVTRMSTLRSTRLVTNSSRMFSTPTVNEWAPVDVYVGGIEHAILHLLYSRFITKFLYKEKLVAVNEPFKMLLTQGMVVGQTFTDATNGMPMPASKVNYNSASTSCCLLQCLMLTLPQLTVLFIVRLGDRSKSHGRRCQSQSSTALTLRCVRLDD